MSDDLAPFAPHQRDYCSHRLVPSRRDCCSCRRGRSPCAFVRLLGSCRREFHRAPSPRDSSCRMASPSFGGGSSSIRPASWRLAGRQPTRAPAETVATDQKGEVRCCLSLAPSTYASCSSPTCTPVPAFQPSRADMECLARVRRMELSTPSRHLNRRPDCRGGQCVTGGRSCECRLQCWQPCSPPSRQP
jgi:hypothetical protein